MQNGSENSATPTLAGGRIKNDIFLILAMLLIAVVVYLIFALGGTEGNTVVIVCDGQRTDTYALSEDASFTVGDTSSGSFNNIVIKDGEVFVSEASCPDGICVGHRPISRVGETVVCLPNRLVIEIE